MHVILLVQMYMYYEFAGSWHGPPAGSRQVLPALCLLPLVILVLMIHFLINFLTDFLFR